MKKLLYVVLTSLLMLSYTKSGATSNNANSTQITTQTTSTATNPFANKTYKIEWTIKKTGQVMMTKSVTISLNDPENQKPTGKVVFAPQLMQAGNFKYTVGLNIDMKLVVANNDKLLLGVVGNYTDPNGLYDLTQPMPDEQNIAHSQIKYSPVFLPNGTTIPLNSATFMKGYDITSPNGTEITVNRFIIKDSSNQSANSALNSSLIEISFKIYEF